jgi:hypothetical protein
LPLPCPTLHIPIDALLRSRAAARASSISPSQHSAAQRCSSRSTGTRAFASFAQVCPRAE